MGQGSRRAQLLALAALELWTRELGAEPVKPSLELRALLAFLYGCSNGERWPFDSFWRNATRSMESETQPAYLRKTQGRSNWLAVVRASGIDPNDRSFVSALHQVILQHEQAANPDAEARRLAADAVRLAGAVKVLDATKGHPRSWGSAKLAAYMRANGGSAEGFDPRAAASTIEDRDGCGWL